MYLSFFLLAICLSLSAMCVPQQDARYCSELNHGGSPTTLPSPLSVPRDQTNLPLFAPSQRQFHLLAISCPACVSVTHKTNPSVMSLWTPQLRPKGVTTPTMQYLSHLRIQHPKQVRSQVFTLLSRSRSSGI